MRAPALARPLPRTLWKWLLLDGVVFFVLVELEKSRARLLPERNHGFTRHPDKTLRAMPA